MAEIHNNYVVLSGPIALNLGQSPVLAGLLNHPMVEDVRESPHRRQNEASGNERSMPRGQLPFSLQIASTRNSDIFQELTQIRSKLDGTSKWVGGNNFNTGTICDTACCDIYLQI